MMDLDGFKEKLRHLFDLIPDRTTEQRAALKAVVMNAFENGQAGAAEECRDECRNRVSVRAWQVIRTLVFQRDYYECQYCGDTVESPHCDHIIPISRGGLTVPDNLTTACGSCNTSKRDKTPEEWLQ